MNPTITDPYLPDNAANTPVIGLMTFPVAIDEMKEAASLNVYPNPSGGIFNIEFDAGVAKSANVIVKDMMGKIVYQRALGSLSGPQHHTIDISALAAGVYIAELDCDGQKMISKISIR